MKAAVAVLVLAACCWPRCHSLSDKSDLAGRYCSQRTPSCCRSRLDGCSVPILDSLCYCDEFCDRPDNDDCCPDYGHVCLNLTRPTPSPPPIIKKGDCWHYGRPHQQGSVFKYNCNTCKCAEVCEGPPYRTCRMQVTCDQVPCLLDHRRMDHRRQGAEDVEGWGRGRGWRAGNYTEFWGRTLEEGVTRRLGTRHSKRRAYTMRAIKPAFDRERVRAVVSFDLRQRRPTPVSPPLDQGWCAADWAISTVQVATDRLMLVSQGEDRTSLSPQHLLSCNAKNQRGCAGGHITRAWKFIQKFGLVPDACYPWEGGRQTNCTVAKTQDRKRTMSRCSGGNSVMSLHRSGPAYRISREPESIMYEIQTSGPVQATMRVPPEFFSYRSGIFRCNATSRRTDSYHAVRVVGWGEELQQGQLVKYWIVSNSWGTWWGEGGYFRIVRGMNECEIESLVLGAWLNPILPKKDPSITMMDHSNLMSNSLA